LNNTILITGGSGLVGKDLQTLLYPKEDCVFLSSKDCDLTNYADTLKLFKQYEPSIIVHLAARVGGLKANMDDRIGFYEDNIQINTNVISITNKLNIQKLIAVSSTCVFPDKLNKEIMTEDDLHLGPPHASNVGYAVAKRCMSTHIDILRNDKKRNYCYLMPTNMFGLNDNFDLQTSHFVPALLRKIIEAVRNNESSITLWGDGSPKRQILWSKDLAMLIVLMIKFNIYENFIVAPKDNLSIKEIAEQTINLICSEKPIIINWDTDYPNGQEQKYCSSDKLKSFSRRLGGFMFSSYEMAIRQVVPQLQYLKWEDK
jgi:GDP-L-fucose synthase